MVQPETNPPEDSGTVFVCYAHGDNDSQDQSERWLDRLLEHLHSVNLGTECSAWSDRDIGLGKDWHAEIQSSISGARVAVLLVSSAFLKSRYIREHELPLMLQQRDAGTLLVIPLLIRPCAFSETSYRYPSPQDGPEELCLATLQTPTSASNPLSALKKHEQDEILSKLAAFIRRYLVGAGSAEEFNLDLDPGQPPASISERKGVLLGIAALVVLLSVFGLIVLPKFIDRRGSGGAKPPPAVLPSVLFNRLSSTDIERLQGATEIDVVRLAAECESEQLQRFAGLFEQRPAVLLALVDLVVASPDTSDATIRLSDRDRRRLRDAGENDVVRLAQECENAFIAELGEVLGDEPMLLLEIIKELRK